MKLILASQSPRRKELLKKTGYDFEVITSDVEEHTTEVAPDKVVLELSKIKANDVFAKMKGKCNTENVVVIGADTIVSVDGTILGKPNSKQEAYEMIKKIEGNTHQVYTGVTILKNQSDTNNVYETSFVECTCVTVFQMTEKEIEEYIEIGDCMDKAGAYGIQGTFGIYVEKINGDYDNVVGLPTARVYHKLKELID